MNEVKKNNSTSFADDYMEKFSLKSRLNEILIKEEDGHLPSVLTANLGIFAVCSAILLSTNSKAIDATKILVLTATIFSLITIPLNIWYITRLKIRVEKFRKEYETTFEKTKKDIVKTFELFSTIITDSIEKQAELLKESNTDKYELLKKFNELNKDGSTEYLVDKGMYIFQCLNELSFYKAIYKYQKFMDSPLDEAWPTLKLFIDRLSSKLKNSGLVINCILLICALLVTTLIN